MAEVASPVLLTAEEFAELAADRRCELIAGEVVERAPAGSEHADVEAAIVGHLRVFAQRHGCGRVYGSSQGIIVDAESRTVLEPDGSFLAGFRGRSPRRFLDRVPDLVLEVVSPSDRASDVQQKVQHWLQAGVKVVWVAYPDTATIEVRRQDGTGHTLGRGAVLACDDLLPGFELPLSDIFVTDDE